METIIIKTNGHKFLFQNGADGIEFHVHCYYCSRHGLKVHVSEVPNKYPFNKGIIFFCRDCKRQIEPWRVIIQEDMSI
jgi:hypothetical protein